MNLYYCDPKYGFDYKYELTDKGVLIRLIKDKWDIFATNTTSSIPPIDIELPGEIDGQPVYALGSNLFANVNALRSIVIPASVMRIENECFWSCANLISVKMPPRLTMLGQSAFNGCTALPKLTLPDGIKCIQKKCINNCISIQSITIPPSVNKISDRAFEHCKNLKNIVFNKKLTTIGTRAFAQCESLEEVILPESLKSIDEGAFYSAGIKRICIPDGFTGSFDIAQLGICECESIEEIAFGRNSYNVEAGPTRYRNDFFHRYGHYNRDERANNTYVKGHCYDLLLPNNIRVVGGEKVISISNENGILTRIIWAAKHKDVPPGYCAYGYDYTETVEAAVEKYQGYLQEKLIKAQKKT